MSSCSSLGKESAAYKKVFAAQLKDEDDYEKKKVAGRKLSEKQLADLHKQEMATAGDVLSFTLDLLNQDEDARKKHHALYVALAVAKVVVDGITEVQNIWEKSSEFGPAGIALAVVQTALAAARTGVAISKLSKSDSSDNGYAKGGVTGTGSGLAVSPMGQLLAMSGMSVGTDGRLQDGTGFAVAGVVHEDEYVIPKWQRQDPQVAAVEQWLEARRLRGFADGGPTSSASSGAALPVAAASPTTDGEKLYAVMAQMLDVNRTMAQQLADVKNWQSQLQVVNSLQGTQAGLDELK